MPRSGGRGARQDAGHARSPEAAPRRRRPLAGGGPSPDVARTRGADAVRGLAPCTPGRRARPDARQAVPHTAPAALVQRPRAPTGPPPRRSRRALVAPRRSGPDTDSPGHPPAAPARTPWPPPRRGPVTSPGPRRSGPDTGPRPHPRRGPVASPAHPTAVPAQTPRPTPQRSRHRRPGPPRSSPDTDRRPRRPAGVQSRARPAPERDPHRPPARPRTGPVANTRPTVRAGDLSARPHVAPL